MTVDAGQTFGFIYPTGLEQVCLGGGYEAGDVSVP